MGQRPAYNSNGRTFPSDNEGLQLWPSIAQKVDTVNIMAYDAANITFDHERILQNFVEHGVPKEKVRVRVRVRVRARARVRVRLGLGLA